MSVLGSKRRLWQSGTFGLSELQLSGRTGLTHQQYRLPFRRRNEARFIAAVKFGIPKAVVRHAPIEPD